MAATVPVLQSNPATNPPGYNPNMMPGGAQPVAYQQVPSTQGYYQTQPYANAVYQPAPAVVTQPIVIPVQYVEPAAPVVYDQPAPTVIYADPVGFAGYNNYHFGNRCRTGGHVTGGFRNCGRVNVGTPGMRVLSQGNMGTRVLSQAGGGARFCPPSQGFGRRGR